MSEPRREDDQDFAAERRTLDRWIHSDPSRPVYTAVRTAFIERFARYYVLLTAHVKGGPVSREMLATLDEECMQLAGMLFRCSNVWAARDWRKSPIVKFLLRAIGRRREGRPATKQQVAMQAKEMKLADPKRWTWPKITAALCDCGQTHTTRCQDNLRREVLHLEKILSRLDCSL